MPSVSPFICNPKISRLTALHLTGMRIMLFDCVFHDILCLHAATRIFRTALSILVVLYHGIGKSGFMAAGKLPSMLAGAGQLAWLGQIRK